MAQIFGSIAITGMLAPTDSADTFSVYEDIYNRGGYRTVTTNTDLKQITRPRRKLGMMVHVTATGKTWILTTEPHAWDLQTAPTLVGNTDIAPYAPYTGVGGDSVVANANATGDWTELTTGGGGAGDFTGPSMELQVEGIAAGSSFTTVPLPNMWDNLLYPIHFINFGITGVAGYVLEAGVESIPLNSTFEWSNYHDSYINPSGTPDFILEALAPNAADIGGSPLTISNPTFGAGTYTSANSVLSGNITSAVDTVHEFKISATSTGGLTVVKNLKVFWRNAFYIGSFGFWGLGKLFMGDGSQQNPATTLALLESNAAMLDNGANLYNDTNVTKYIKDPIPANYDYSVWHNAPTMNGSIGGLWFGPSANMDFKGMIMPQAYFAGLAGGAFVAGTSSVSVSYNIAGSITTGTLLNVSEDGSNIVFTEGGVNYIGFQTSNAIVMGGTMRIDTYNI